MALQQPYKPGAKGSSVLQDARAQEEAERQDRHRTADLADECGKVEEDLEALKARYEMYFLGIERREPTRERTELKRRVAHLKGEFTRNTGLRFRIETLHARYLSYERLWARSAREKEEGTYRRDLIRARRSAELAAKRAAAEAAKSPAAPVKEAAAAAKPAPAATPAAAAPTAPAATAPTATPPPLPAAAAPAPAAGHGMTEPQLRALYSAYVEAKKRCNEDVSRISYDALARSVAKQVPELMAKYQARSIEFKVVIKDGRAILKAVPKV